MQNECLLIQQVEDYITYKRGLGYKIIVEADELRRFATFAKSIGHNGSLTNELAMRWATLKSEYSRFYMARRLEIIQTFAKYITAFDPCAQIPQTGVFGKCHGRVSPHIYSDAEISLLITEARKLYSPDGIRAYTVSAAIGLLRATGLRPSELTQLKVEDVRLSTGYVFIHSSKFKKDRIVPLHSTVLKELSVYSDYIEGKLGPRCNSDYFFVSTYGQRFNSRSFEYAFQLIRPILYKDGACVGTRNYRLYDVRHTFACETIRHWLETGDDVNKKLYLLSTYMGHVKPEDTYWYLSATPQLLAVSCERYETVFGEEATK